MRRLKRRNDHSNAYPIVNSNKPKVSVVIPAMNERKNIGRIIANARKVHPEAEVIVVANGSNDGTQLIAQQMGAKVIYYAFPLGHDVGRSIGALHARGEVILFTDADIFIPASRLSPYVDAVISGVDVALNKYIGKTRTKKVHSVVVAKHALNAILGRPDLKGSSMTTIPHAISRRAMETIGIELLAVPPKAMAAAVVRGLNVQRTAYVEVGRSNPKKRKWKKVDPLKDLIVGDHLEAMKWVIDHTDERGGFNDSIRKRDLVR